MRRRAIDRGDATGLSLVPMADMLTNTVGIMLFIMAFTILASAGAAVLRHLPKETNSQASPVFFVCVNQRILPLDRAITKQLTDNLPRPSFGTLENWVGRFNAIRHEGEFFVVTGEGRAVYNTFGSSARLQLSMKYTPKQGAGDDEVSLKSPQSRLAQQLGKVSGDSHFVYFIVYPDSVDIFRTARAIVVDRFKMGVGWGPMGQGAPIGISLTGEGGLRPEPQSN